MKSRESFAGNILPGTFFIIIHLRYRVNLGRLIFSSVVSVWFQVVYHHHLITLTSADTHNLQ